MAPLELWSLVDPVSLGSFGGKTMLRKENKQGEEAMVAVALSFLQRPEDFDNAIANYLKITGDKDQTKTKHPDCKN
jgi:hypothetical protein